MCIVILYHCFVLLEIVFSFLLTACNLVSDSHGLGELYEEWYAKQDMERDFTKVNHS